ncbi:MAG TPA: TadE/TadG family type IV pilus assembly protein [Patescibacteria group bacterium]|nr:TadE/TadG family type IV pilus assembly protein [Patescibacteria group bacterium]
MTRRRRDARGQVVVMFGLGLVVILLIVGLVVDGGKAFFERRSGQNDADVAALAGTKVVADGYTLTGGTNRGMAYAEIQRSIIANGCTAGGTEPCTWSASFVGQGQRPVGPVNAGDSAGFVGSGILGVRVDVRRTPRTYFLGLIGRSSWEVETSATALAAKPDRAPASQVLPIGLHEPTIPFQAGQIYDLTANKGAPGGFVWLSWSTLNDAATLRSSVCRPNNKAFDIGASIRTGPVSVDPTDVPCLTTWMQSKTTVLIPIYDQPTGYALASTYRIHRLAAFVIVGVGQPTGHDIRAYFVGTYAYPIAPAGVGDQPPDKTDSLYYIGLTR